MIAAQNKLRIGGIDDMSFIEAADTDIAYSIYFQGCNRHCLGCHNPELLPFTDGKDMTVDEILSPMKRHIGLYGAVAVLGGEPLEQSGGLMTLLSECKDLGLETWLYTGYDLYEVPEEIIDLCDVIVAGAYCEDLKTGGFPASSNQIVYDKRGQSK